MNTPFTTIETLTETKTHLLVTWQNQQQTQHSWFWLKDHSEDEVSLHPDTLQRQIETFNIDPHIHPERFHLDIDTQHIHIHWPDHSHSLISAQLLSEVSHYQVKRPAADHQARSLWQAEQMPDTPRIEYQQIMDTETGVLQWLQLIHQYGFAVVENTNTSEQGTRQLAERIAPAQHTIFGQYWPLSAELSEHEDSAYSQNYIGPHTDGTYYHNAAGLQMFNCVEFNGQGGESILVDGFAIAEAMRSECPHHFQTLVETPVPGRYLEPGVHLQAERPVITLNLDQSLKQISFNHYDRAPFQLAPEQMQAFYAAYGEFYRRINHQAHWFTLPLRPGTALIFDNWRCLHGRMGYSGQRMFWGCYHDKAIAESRLRTLSNEA